MERFRKFVRALNGWMENDGVRAALAVALFFAAGVACVSGGDQAPTSSVFATTTATISGTTLPGARVATDRGEYSTTANASGAYSLSVAGGVTYNIFASANGYKTVVQQGVRITSGEAKTINLTLGTLLGPSERTYVGSSQCKLCHSTQYSRWSNAPHRYGISSPGDSPGILSAVQTLFNQGYSLRANSAFSNSGAPDTAPILTKSGDTYYVSIGACSYPVTYAMGYQWKQRFLTKIGEAHYILPIQYNVATSEWVSYNPTNWYTSAWNPTHATQSSLETDIYKLNSWERKCAGCHSVTGILKLEFSASTTSGITQHRMEWLEKGIGCEACHGPASAHVWGNGALGTTADPYIINPSKLSVGQRMDVCGQCHSRGLSVGKLAGQSANFYNTTNDTYTLEYYFDGTRTFRPGDTLNLYYTDAGGYWTDSYAEARTSKQHHQQWNDLYQSGHMMAGAATTVTCGSCHDPHGPVGYSRQMKLSAQNDAMCLYCHGPNGAAKQRFTTDSAVVQHIGTEHRTYDPSGSSQAGRCINCHMPYTAKTAVNYDIRSHTFRVIRPHDSRRFAVASQSETIPNSCQQACHNGTSGRGNAFGGDAAGALLAAQNFDSTVQEPGFNTPDTPVYVVTGTVQVTAASSTDSVFGAQVTVDHNNKGCVVNRNGTYYLLLDVPGTYVLRAWKAGFESVAVTISANAAGRLTQNFTLNATTSPTTKSLRCEACHGGVWGAEWRRSAFEGRRYSFAEDITAAELAAGHAQLAQSPSGRTSIGTSTCQKCHEAHVSAYYLTSRDTQYGGIGPDTTLGGQSLAGLILRGPSSRKGVTCLVCHKPHGEGSANSQLRIYNTTGIDTGRLYGPNSSGVGTLNGVVQSSMPFPASYQSAACIYCHNGRTAPTDSGAGIRTTSGESRPVSTPHLGNNSEGFFGMYQGVSGHSLNFDSAPGFAPRNSRHVDSWATYYSYQAYVYNSSGAPKLVSQAGSPVVKRDSFTCVSCHMYNQEPGTHSTGTNSTHDGGHTWKPDVRACGVCHDPVYVSLNPYTNPMKAGSTQAGDVGRWGTDSWGVSSSGRILGLDRPVAALPHQSDSGSNLAATTATRAADGIFNDYDGNGKAEGAHKEAEHLMYRVLAAFCTGVFHGETSALTALGVDTGFGHTFLGSSPYWNYNKTRAATRQMTGDEARIAWNLVLMEHDASNVGSHNLRFTVETLRQMWTILGRWQTNVATWVPPGDDY